MTAIFLSIFRLYLFQWVKVWCNSNQQPLRTVVVPLALNQTHSKIMGHWERLSHGERYDT